MTDRFADEDLDLDEESRLDTVCRALIEQVQRFDKELSVRRVVGRVSDEEYREWRAWRTKAIAEREALLRRYRRKRDELKALRREKTEAAREYLAETDGPDAIIKSLLSVAVECRAYEDPRHQETMNRARAYLGQSDGRIE